MSTKITTERPDTADALLLIAELEAYLDPLYPPASRHGLSVEQFLVEAVAFFVLRYNGTSAGCAGIKLVGSAYGEVKRMYVRPQFRGFGLGKLLLNHLASHARNHGVGCLRLETGIFQTEAIALYERVGFRRIPPFGNYPEDPLSTALHKFVADLGHRFGITAASRSRSVSPRIYAMLYLVSFMRS